MHLRRSLSLSHGSSVPPASRWARFGVSADEAFGPAIAKHETLGLLERADGRLRLTERGLLLSNEVFVDLLPDNE